MLFQVFNVLPLAARIDYRIFCVHAGISPDMLEHGPDILNTEIRRPCQVRGTSFRLAQNFGRVPTQLYRFPKKTNIWKS